MERLELFAGAPAGFDAGLLDPTIAVAAARAGAIGLLDGELASDALIAAALSELRQRCPSGGAFALKLSLAQWAEALQGATLGEQLASSRVRWAVLALGELAADRTAAQPLLATCVAGLREHGLRLVLEVVSSAEAALADGLALDGLIAKGHEAEGRVGEETAFILLQRLRSERSEPIYVHGGVGLHTAAAYLLGGARGAVLTCPLLLTRESPLSDEILARLARLDGTETQCHALSSELASPASPLRYRLYARPGSPAAEAVQALVRRCQELPAAEAVSELRAHVQAPPRQRAWVLGQDIAFAGRLAARHGSTAAVLQALQAVVPQQLAEVAEVLPLAEGSPLARAHGTRYPIVQGAMTRVSDHAELAFHVADTGALPFLALSLLRGAEVDELLTATTRRLGALPYGVGILGFVPHELRSEQLEVVLRHKPPFALIAGGRPDQAQALEAQGIKTYLHVPSPLLLRSFLELGARRFIFEGRECGGHVGPRSSFVLWEAMVAELLAAAEAGLAVRGAQVLFAGGISDGISAAMAVTIAAPLLRLGVEVGVLMGTAYLFTDEAVQSGAITPRFHREVLRCERTVLFETGPGHAIRCIDSPYRQTFDAHRRELSAQNKGHEEIRIALEMQNVGRLRIASKGVARVGSALTELPEEQQWQEGMYMVGQVAALPERPRTMRALHEEVSLRGCELLRTAPERYTAERAEPPWTRRTPRRAEDDVAIIGMSCLFPEANQLASFWRNILARVDAITEVPRSHWAWELLYDPDPLARDKCYSKWGGFLGDVPFDPRRYGIPPSSLASIDPMQLLMLELTRAAISDAGYERRALPRERTSVILANAGHGPITALYSLRSMLGWLLADLPVAEREALANRLPEWTEDSFAGYLGNVTAGRVSNRFDLGGVNFSVDAACASSLAALYLGVRELREQTSDLVLLSAVDTHNQPGDYLSFAKTHALSPGGRCRTFDASADGIVISEGGAVLILKRLADAQRDGDRIYAIIRGVGGSSDGRDRSLTAPRPEGQLLALERAYADAGVSPATVGLVEAHGTGTAAGDRAEVAALTKLFQSAGTPQGACALGSVKTMIGHTKCAAGLASVIKVAKALHHKLLPPTMGVTRPNPACEFERGPFYLCTEPRPWLHQAESPRRAGVSAFGFGGTNFHVVLEEHTALPYVPGRAEGPSCPDWPSELFTLVAATPADLAGRIEQLRSEVAAEEQRAAALVGPVESERPQRSLAELAYAHYLRGLERPASAKLSLTVVASSLADLGQKLGSAAEQLRKHQERAKTEPAPLVIRDPRGIYCFGEPLAATRRIAFLFPGQGPQRVGMLRELSLYFPSVRAVYERADHQLAGRLPRALSSYIFPPPPFSDAEREAQHQAVTDTRIAQCAVGAADLAALALLRSFGIDSELLAGHSYGEYVALHVAGVFSEAGLLSVSATRGRLLAEPPDGQSSAMAAVGTSVEALQSLLSAQKDPLLAEVTIANHNSPSQTVVAGSVAAIDRAVSALSGHGLPIKKIPVSAAFHSERMRYAQAPLSQAIGEALLGPPQRQVYSNLDARPYAQDAAAIAPRLCQHLIEPVLFYQTVRALHEAGAGLFVEVGPGAVLSKLTEATLKDLPHLAVPIERPGMDGLTSLLHALALLAAHGVAVDESALYRDRRAALALHVPYVPSERAAAKPAQPELRYAMNSARIERIGGSPPAVRKVAAVDKTPSPSPQPQSSQKGTSPPMTVSPSRQPPAPPAPERPAAPSPWPLRPEVSPSPLWATAHSGIEQVMLQFQQTMLQMSSGFLETQQRVMLAYLEGAQGAGAQLAKAEGATALSLPPSAPLAIVHAAPPPASTPPAVIQHAAPVEVLPTAPAPAPAAASPAAAPQDLGAQLLQLVSERTGYPLEMLDPNLDLEADLGIDSLKRLEILNSFRKLLPAERQQQLEKDVEKLATSRTLKSILDFLSQSAPASEAGGLPARPEQAPGIAAVSAPPIAGALPGPTSTPPSAAESQHLQRALRREIELPAPAASVTRGGNDALRSGRPLLVISDRFAHTAPLLAALAQSQVATVHASTHEASAAYSVQLDDEADVQRLAQRLREERGGLAGVLLLFGRDEAADAAAADGRLPTRLARLILAAKTLHAQICEGLVLCVTQIDDAVEAAALAGALRSLSREWPRAVVRSVSFDATMTADRCTQCISSELFAEGAPREVSYRAGRRYGYAAEPLPLPRLASSEALAELGPHSVVVITGGARGVTAAAALELARRYRPQLVLVGRSPLPPAQEAADTAGLTSARELKAALMQREKQRRQGQPIAIPAIEQAYAELLREREVRKTLAELARLGTRVHYHACDVSDPDAAAALVGKLYAAHGRIDGLIHGAGIIEDALVHQKSLASARRVYETKVRSARALLSALRVEELRFCAFFSSIVAHTGNAGQLDYAAANAALGELARETDRRTPGRVVSLLWGPWRGGMVRPALEEHLRRAGWELIEEAAGVKACVDELRLGHKGELEVLLTAPVPVSRTEPPPEPGSSGAVRLLRAPIGRPAAGVVELALRLDVAVDRYLVDHSIDGVPVLPLAGALSLIGEAAVLASPGWQLGRIDELVLLSGIKLTGGSHEAVLRCTEVESTAGERRLQVELLSAEGKRRPHYRARVRLVPSPLRLLDELARDAVPPRVGSLQEAPVLSEIYGGMLFHGPLFQGIIALEGFGPSGVAGRLRASRPADCLVGASAEQRWLIDPVLLDSAMQLAGVWARHHAGITVLPTGCQSLVRLGEPRGERCLGRVRIHAAADGSELHCDVAVLNEDESPVLLMLGLRGVGSAALNRLGARPAPTLVRQVAP